MKKDKKKSALSRILKILISIVLVLVIIVLSYVSYVFIDYKRIEDKQVLSVEDKNSNIVKTDTNLKAVSYNIGFCAYTQDFSFFMDGGTESRAKSEESVYNVLDGINSLLKEENPDIVMMQEVDENADRSHHVDQKSYITDSFTDYDNVFAVNYDSSYLFYPIFKPIGKSLSGILTMSKYDIDSSIRRSLKIEDSFMKFFDLDRCYSVSRMKTDNNKELVVYTVHLSAYTSDGSIATQQLEMLVEDMKTEYEKGNYVLCGGDFNKDLLLDSGSIFGVSGEDYTWAQAFPVDMLNDTGLSLVAPFDGNNPVATCRNTDEPYKEEGQFNVTLDGFIVSDNIEVSESNVIDVKFEYSDHNPVYVYFKLLK